MAVMLPAETALMLLMSEPSKAGYFPAAVSWTSWLLPLKALPCSVTEDDKRVNALVPEPVPENCAAFAVTVPAVTNDGSRAKGEVPVPVPENCVPVTVIVPAVTKED